MQNVEPLTCRRKKINPSATVLKKPNDTGKPWTWQLWLTPNTRGRASSELNTRAESERNLSSQSQTHPSNTRQMLSVENIIFTNSESKAHLNNFA